MQRSEQGRPLDFKMCGSITSPSKRHSVLQAWEADWLEVELIHKQNFCKPCPRRRRVLLFSVAYFRIPKHSIIGSDCTYYRPAFTKLSSCKLFQNPFLNACRICLALPFISIVFYGIWAINHVVDSSSCPPDRDSPPTRTSCPTMRDKEFA